MGCVLYMLVVTVDEVCNDRLVNNAIEPFLRRLPISRDN
jgi:hypothetical protein